MRGNTLNIANALKINSKVEIALINDEENLTFAHSLIQDLNNDSFSILVPMHKGHILYLVVGDVAPDRELNLRRVVVETKVLRKVGLPTDIFLIVGKTVVDSVTGIGGA